MEGHARTSPNQIAATENRRAQTHQAIDPSDIAHHLRVAADKYHENARVLLEDMNEAIQALPDERKPAYRHTREALAKLFDDQASDAMRQAKMFDDATTDTLAGVPVILYGTCDPEVARNLAEAALALDSAFDGGNLIRDRLIAGKVNRPAIPEGRDTPASDHELTTAINAVPKHEICSSCGSVIAPGTLCFREAFSQTPKTMCSGCIESRVHGSAAATIADGVPTIDHAACSNDGSLQHTPNAPTTWIGNEQFNRRVGGEA